MAADEAGAAGDQNFHLNRLHQLALLLLLLFDGFHQFELRPAAVEVVSLAIYLEIGVPGRKINQKTNRNPERGELDGQSEKLRSCLVKEPEARAG